MSDDLAVGGPGTTTVLTTEIEQEAQQLAQLGWELEETQRQIGAIDRMVGNGILGAADAPLSALNAEAAIDEAFAALTNARERCDRLHRGLLFSAEYYQQTEHAIWTLGQHAAAQLGYLVGRIAPVLVAAILPGAIITAGGFALVIASLPVAERERLVSSLRSWLSQRSAALTDPRVVTAVRLSAMSSDDFGAGLMGVPQIISGALGDEGLGIVGIDTSAFVVMGAGAGLGLLRETPVRVTASSVRHDVSTADNIRDRLERIPGNPEQIRIDRYSSQGEPDRFEVYIGGTEDFSPESGTQPFDLTSNIAAVSGGSNGAGAGSYQAVVEAMRLAGIDRTSTVDFTGYSQGGLLAAQLVASGDYQVGGLLTVGAPAGQVSVPHNIPYLAIEHTDDLVPAFGGTFATSDPTVVKRRVFDAPPAADQPVMPAHRLTNYLDTAALMDESANVRLTEMIQNFVRPHAESSTSTLYLAERVQQ